jgi:hypothetical protein
LPHLFLQSDATFGGSQNCYRYTLSRTWDASKDHVCWVMLNPSTADATKDDPTIRRCMGFAQRWGYGGIVVVNIFALRATKPEALRRHPEPVGRPENDRVIVAEAARAARVMAAWGEYGRWAGRNLEVRKLLKDIHVECLAQTFNRDPRHPLYVAGATEPVTFTAKGTE